MKLYSFKDGEQLVRAARNAIELYLSSPKFEEKMISAHLEKFTERHGVFVTIEHYPTRTLRGCIGFTYGVKPVKERLVEAAIAAAVEDPRFVPVSHMEFEHIVVEVNILSKPEKINGKTPSEIKKQVKVGRDGLMVKYGYYSGLLLPIVAVDEHWDSERFLDNVCIKAGLPDYKWRHSDVELYKFTSQAFKELSPRGPVEEIVFE